MNDPQTALESPPAEAEFTSDDDSLGWDADGWDEFSAKGAEERRAVRRDEA